MPSILHNEPLDLLERSFDLLRNVEASAAHLAKRINIPLNSTSSPAQVAASFQDPWSKSSKYALGWTYFAIGLLLVATVVRCYHLWGDKIRTALYKQEVVDSTRIISPQYYYETPSVATATSTTQFFPPNGQLPEKPKEQSAVSTIAPINNTIAFFRMLFYRPLPIFKIGRIEIVFPSLGVTVIVSAALIFTMVYTFVPQPLYYESMAFGSPPVAIRAGMLSVAMMPWIIGLSMKANLISVMTGIDHERLNVLHRWGGYLCLLLALIHMIPFYLQPLWDPSGFDDFKWYFTQKGQSWYIYTTGIAAFVPLGFLCVHSLPILRNWMYELFVALHVPVSIVFVGMLFWHCNNYLTSWNYLYATIAIWVFSYFMRIFFLNWMNPLHMSWLIGEESAVTILPENAIKVTIPTQRKWRPGQYVYLRMPGISFLENHPFTIASLCSDDFPSLYGEEFRDMALVFRPFQGFTRKVRDTALAKGPYKTYRAFIDGPYGGMQREMASFDTVYFFAGGSGITAIASQLLDLIKRMRDGKAVTKSVRVVWALKRPETMEWFKEELRICREYAPPNSVECQFFITATKRYEPGDTEPPRSRPPSGILHDKIDDMFQGFATKRHSELIREEAAGDVEREKELRRENEDTITALPQAHAVPSRPTINTNIANSGPSRWSMATSSPMEPARTFDFGFPETPSKFQKSLMRFAFLPTPRKDGWRTEYGRPDIPFMLKNLSRDFGRRTCVFVCGPPSMRIDVANTVARLQSQVLHDAGKDEIFLHAENYAI